MKIIRNFWYGLGRLATFLLVPILKRTMLKGSHRTRLVVYCDGKIIVEKNWLGEKDWVLPGGGLKRGEAVEVGAVRELYEEVGIKVSADKVRILKKQPSPIKGYNFDVTYCLVVLEECLPIKISRFEIFDAKWLDVDKISAENVVADVTVGLELGVQAEPNLIK